MCSQYLSVKYLVTLRPLMSLNGRFFPTFSRALRIFCTCVTPRKKHIQLLLDIYLHVPPSTGVHVFFDQSNFQVQQVVVSVVGPSDLFPVGGDDAYVSG